LKGPVTALGSCIDAEGRGIAYRGRGGEEKASGQ